MTKTTRWLYAATAACMIVAAALLVNAVALRSDTSAKNSAVADLRSKMVALEAHAKKAQRESAAIVAASAKDAATVARFDRITKQLEQRRTELKNAVQATQDSLYSRYGVRDNAVDVWNSGDNAAAIAAIQQDASVTPAALNALLDRESAAISAFETTVAELERAVNQTKAAGS